MHTLYQEEHELFRSSFRKFIDREAVPHTELWETDGMVPRSFWIEAGRHGFLGFEAPPDYGGSGIRDFRFNAIIGEEMSYAGAVGDGFSMANDIVGPYLFDLTTEDQKNRWLPGLTSGTLVPAIAMSEPHAGSDLRGIRTTATWTGSAYLLNGSKTFVTNGISSDLVVVVTRTEDCGGGFSLFAVESETPGFTRGRRLAKVGRKAQDTGELFFSDVEVPSEHILGEPGRGLEYLKHNLAQERLSIAVTAVAAAERALELTIEYCKSRCAFGQPIGTFQANRFAIADLLSRVWAARSHIDRCIEDHIDSDLSAARAAGAKLLATELQFEVLDRCLQLHGGYGYMDEYEISRLWRDSRVQRIYGGTSEIMKEIVGRHVGL